MPAFARSRMNSTAADPQVAAPKPSPVEREVARIRELCRSRRHAEALAAAEALARPSARESRCALFDGAQPAALERIPEALATLERLEQLHPTLQPAVPGARPLLRRPARCAAGDRCPAARREHQSGAAGELAHARGALSHDGRREERRDRRRSTSRRSSGCRRRWCTPTALFSDGELTPAENIVRAFLLHHGDHVEAMRLLARIGIARDVLDDAELLLEAVLDARARLPRRAPRLCAGARRAAQVPAGARRSSSGCSSSIRRIASTARCRRLPRRLGRARQGDRALPRAARRYAARRPICTCRWRMRSKTIGRSPEAIEAYRAAAAARPNYGDAYWSLANLKTYRFSRRGDRAHERRGSARPKRRSIDRYHLCFALGKALEDRGEYAESWHYYERGNALKRAESRYRPEIIETNTRKQIEVCTQEFFAHRAGCGRREPRPDLHPRPAALGLDADRADPRLAFPGRGHAGTLRHASGSCSSCRAATPISTIRATPALLATLRPEDFQRLGERYLADTRVYRTDKPFFIDKMPNNFRHIGLIHLMLPNARIIDARREPMACCFSNFKQLFANGQEFTYSIEDIARYYRTYLELMRHWDAVLPGRVLARPARGRRRRSRRQRAAASRLLRLSTSSRRASSSTRPSAACAPRVPNRCASRSFATDSSSGKTTSPGSARCAMRSAMP